MNSVIEAVFDGKAFYPIKPFAFKPNTRVRIFVETDLSDKNKTNSFLKTARSLNLDGPPDWSLNLEDYLYGDKADGK